MLNKTPKESAKKTKSARKAVVFSVLVFLVIFSGLMIFSLTRESYQNNKTSQIKPQILPPCLHLSGGCINLEVVDSNQERVKGLSGRDGLPEKGGMMFVFEKSEEQCMWMKDMRFSIDMLWLDSEKKINKIASDVKPESYPETFCSDNTKFVVELNAGTVIKAGLQQGQTLNIIQPL